MNDVNNSKRHYKCIEFKNYFVVYYKKYYRRGE